MPTKQLGRLLTPPQVADRLQLSAGTLAHWRVLRKGPRYFRIGTRIRYREDDVEAFATQAFLGRH